jgi:hypothetical protein
LAVRLPTAVVEAPDLEEGDQIEIRIAGKRKFDNDQSPSVDPWEPAELVEDGLFRTSARSGVEGQLELDHHFDGFTVIHRTVAVGDTVNVRDAIEDEARLDSTLQHVGH